MFLGLFTCFPLSLFDLRLYRLTPMYLGLVRSVWTRLRVHARPRSVRIPCSLRRRTIPSSGMSLSVNRANMLRTIEISSSGPGTSTTRSVWMLFSSPLLRVPFDFAFPIQKLASQTKPRASSLPKAQFNQPRLACKHLCGKLATVLSSHRSFNCLQKG
jgi:hypothetical protein